MNEMPLSLLNLHSVDEWIDIETMVTFYRICERYVARKLLEG